MADLLLSHDGLDLVLTIGAESARVPLSGVDALTYRMCDVVRDARDQQAATMRAEKRAAEVARAKEAHPDGWAMPGDQWGFVNTHGHPGCAPFTGSSAEPAIVASAPSHLRWRNYGGRLLHIGGGFGYRCGARVDAPTVTAEGGRWRVCSRCAAGVDRG